MRAADSATCTARQVQALLITNLAASRWTSQRSGVRAHPLRSTSRHKLPGPCPDATGAGTPGACSRAARRPTARRATALRLCRRQRLGLPPLMHPLCLKPQHQSYTLLFGSAESSKSSKMFTGAMVSMTLFSDMLARLRCDQKMLSTVSTWRRRRHVHSGGRLFPKPAVRRRCRVQHLISFCRLSVAVAVAAAAWRLSVAWRAAHDESGGLAATPPTSRLLASDRGEHLVLAVSLCVQGSLPAPFGLALTRLHVGQSTVDVVGGASRGQQTKHLESLVQL